MAETEGVAPLVWWKLRRWAASGEGRLAANSPLRNLLTVLAPAYYETLARNTLLLRELARILEAFDAAGIETIVLKGAALAQTVYEDIGLRPMNDIDLLVRPEDVEKAVAIMRRLDYQLNAPPEHRRGMWKTIHYDYPLKHRDDGLLVELHWNVIGPHSDWREPPTEILWDSPYRWRLPAGKEFRVLPPLLFLSSLAAHLLFRHGLSRARLLWYMDIYFLAQYIESRPDVKADDFPAFAPWETSGAMALRNVEVLFDTPMQLFQIAPEMYHSQTVKFISRKTEVTQTHSLEILQRLKKQPFQKSKTVVLGYLLPSATYMRKRYSIRHNALLPFYYLYRWGDILREVLMVWAVTWWEKFISIR